MNIALLTLSLAFAADAPKPVYLWPKGAPEAKGDQPADKPFIDLYPAPASSATGTAILVCPGGGYGGLALGHEGKDIAQWLNKIGVSAYVLHYRLNPYRHPVPLMDAQRALRTVRANAKEWHIAPDRIGVWGFSAGGHLASTLATHFDDGKADAPDPIDRVGCRPDFAILAYPVITMAGPFVHGGSRDNLLGKDPAPELIENLSNQKQVTARTPPTFLFHTTEDTVVPSENSVLFYSALVKAKVPAELHIYEKGRHGVGLAAGDEALSTWPGRLKDWLGVHNLLKPQP
jgi:acetyl esterase/lipase